MDVRKGGAKSLTGKEDFCLAAPTLTDTAEVDFAPQIRWHPDGRRLWLQLGGAELELRDEEGDPVDPEDLNQPRKTL